MSTNNSTNRLIKIKQLYDECVDRLPKDRFGCYEQSGCNALEIDEVKRLLAISDGEDSAEQHNKIINQQLAQLSSKVEQKQVLDSYQIEKEIGRGGMGIVFLAHRVDGEYQQKVAIKIAPSFSSKNDLIRFHQERQTLAKLQHPNIATLLDGGSTEDNRPYIVMEFIEGQNITDYCLSNRFNLNEIIKLFLQVCQAVSFAHRHLIIHRDIKPENVLVTNDGQVKLLDFGISKALKPHKISHHTTVQKGLTLAYASPEQVRGEPTTTQTDVYGLGALFYQLLTQQVPHCIEKNSAEAVIKAICFSEPVSPSILNRANSQSLNFQLLRGDIDNIVSKALRKEPEERYASVMALEKDLQCFLNDEEVQATKASLSYKIKKLFYRHPVSSLLSMALIVTLIGGLMISVNLTFQLQREVSTSEKVIALLTNMFDAASPENAQGEDISVNQLINAAVSQTEKSLDEKPIVKARLLAELATVYGKLGQYKKAIELLEKSHQLKLTDGSALSVTDIVALANMNRLSGHYSVTLELLKSIDHSFENKPVNTIEHANLNNAWGLYYQVMSKHPLATRYFKSVDTFWRSFSEASSESLAARFNLSLSYEQSRNFQKAVELQELVLADYLELLGENHPTIIHISTSLASNYLTLNDMDKSEQYNQQAYDIARNILDPNTDNYNSVISGYTYLLHAQGRYLAAANLLTDEINENLTNKKTLGFYLTDRAMMNFELGYFEKSLQDLVASRTELTPFYKNSFAFMFNTELYLGVIDGLTGDVSKGKARLEDSLKEVTNIWGDKDIAVAYIKLFQAMIAIKERDFEDSEQLLAQVTALNKMTFGDEAESFSGHNSVYADLLIAQNEWEAALNHIDKSIVMLTKKHPNGSFRLDVMKLKQGQALWNLGQKQQARNLIAPAANRIKNIVNAESIYYQLAESLNKRIASAEVH